MSSGTLWRLGLTVVVTLGLAEAGARLLTRTDDAGRRRFGDVLLKPPLPTPRALDTWVREYRDTEEERVILYDSLLGWAPRPGAQAPERDAAFDRLGARRPVGAMPEAREPGLLIATLGDSYTFGAEVTARESWPHRLEARLDSAGIDAGVRNFGVGAYGMDQAYLRWRLRVRPLEPDVVLFGFQPENVKRNVNVFRPFYLPRTGVMFTKPRFVQVGGDLRLVNSPTARPEELSRIVADPTGWEHAPNEWFLDPGAAAPRWWRGSRLLNVVESVADPPAPTGGRIGADAREFYGPETGPARLALTILDNLRRSVESAGGRFVVVHLPRIGPDVQTVLSGRPLWYDDLWERIRACFTTVDPLDDFVARGRRTGLRRLVRTAHYSPAGNDVVAAEAAGAVARLLEAPAAGPVTPYPACARGADPGPGRPGRSP